MLKKRIFIAIGITLLVLVALLYEALQQAKELRRDPTVLMNRYYRFKNINPEGAKNSLLIILNQNPHYLPALKEYSQWMLNDHNPQQAQHCLEQLHQFLPENNTYTFQLGYLYYMNGDWQKAKPLFLQLLEHVTGPQKDEAQQAINAMASYMPFYQFHATAETLMRITNVDSKQPNNVQALKEAGFLAIAKGRPIEVIDYFTRAYDLTFQPEIAMQLAYLYDQINDKPTAYQYFKLATKGQDKNLSLNAENALTNLAGQQTKVLPLPYYSEIFFNPFTQRRFGLTVAPFLWRLGIEQKNRFHTKEYVFFRRTQDNRSANLGEISQIYEDNVQITGIGGQIAPFKKLPIVGFIEAGEAYDLVYRNRNRWRGDLRGGLMYYQEFGTRPAYYDHLKISYDYFSDWYGDATYFSRYNNNVIGLVRTHQGIRLLQYKSSMLNLYVTGRVIADTRREFFNNIAEVGPGISFIPSNRFNLQLRLEHIKGVYLPAGASVNPYGKYYTNNIVQLLFYVKM